MVKIKTAALNIIADTSAIQNPANASMVNISGVSLLEERSASLEDDFSSMREERQRISSDRSDLLTSKSASVELSGSDGE